MSEASLGSSDMTLFGPYFRLEQALRECSLSQRQLATEVGIAEATVSRAMNGAQTLERHWLPISDALKKRGISSDWLLHGDGQMRIGATSESTRALRDDPPTVPLQAAKFEVGVITADNLLRNAPPNRFHPVPGRNAVQVLDSALEPLVRSGQWVLVTPEADREAVDGDIVLFQTNGARAYVRRLRIVQVPDDGVLYVLEAAKLGEGPLVFTPEDRRMICVVVGVLFE